MMWLFKILRINNFDEVWRNAFDACINIFAMWFVCEREKEKKKKKKKKEKKKLSMNLKNW